jgi:hypothetical protein
MEFSKGDIVRFNTDLIDGPLYAAISDFFYVAVKGTTAKIINKSKGKGTNEYVVEILTLPEDMEPGGKYIHTKPGERDIYDAAIFELIEKATVPKKGLFARLFRF